MSGDDTSSSARKLYGTDLLIGGTIGMEALITALSGCFDMPENCIFPTGDEGHGDAYIDAIGRDNVIALYRLSPEGNLHFNASLDFIAPLQVDRIIRLVERNGLVVALSRDTAFPHEVGTLEGEGYVIFQPNQQPVAGFLVTNDDEQEAYHWVASDERLPSWP